MFHLMFVHYTLSSVWVAQWPSLGKAAHSVGHLFFCLFVIFHLFSILVLRAGFGF